MNAQNTPLLLRQRLLAAWLTRQKRRRGGIKPVTLRQPQPPNPEAEAAFRALWSLVATGARHPVRLDYDLPYPKIDFLNWLCDFQGLVAHGSPLSGLERLEPIRRSSDTSEFGNRQQIFATPDAPWALWFAILNRERFSRTHNICLRIGPRRGAWVKGYYFHLTRDLTPETAFAPGAVYLCRAEDFPSRHRLPLDRLLGLEFEEWGSAQPVQPLAWLPVTPADFPYLNAVEFIL